MRLLDFRTHFVLSKVKCLYVNHLRGLLVLFLFPNLFYTICNGHRDCGHCEDFISKILFWQSHFEKVSFCRWVGIAFYLFFLYVHCIHKWNSQPWNTLVFIFHFS